MNEITPQGNQAQSLKTLTAVNYGLYALSFLIGISAIVAIIINYVKLDDVRNTWLESHFRWQMRTFWFGLDHDRAARPVGRLPRRPRLGGAG